MILIQSNNQVPKEVKGKVFYDSGSLRGESNLNI